MLTGMLRPKLLAVFFAATASAQESPGVTLDGNRLAIGGMPADGGGVVAGDVCAAPG